MKRTRLGPGLLVILAAHAAGNGTVAGAATDQEGRPVTAAYIRVVSVVTGEQVVAGGVRRDALGTKEQVVAAYAFNVPEGSYYLRAEAPGYERLITKTVTVKAGETTPLDLILQTYASKWFTLATAIWALVASFVLSIATPGILRRLYRPSLALDVQAEPPYCHWIEPQFPDARNKQNSEQPANLELIEIYFARVFIRNQGKVEADSVEVSVRQVYQENDGWERICSGKFVPLNLRWSNTWDIVKAGEDAAGELRILTKNRISEGGKHLCDLGFIVKPEHYSEFCKRTKLRDRPPDPSPHSDRTPRFHFAFEFIRDRSRHRLKSGRYVLHVVADALRIRPKSFWIELRIPDTIERRDHERIGLPGFDVQCHEDAPDGIPVTLPLRSRLKRRVRSLLRNFQVRFQRG